MTRNNLWSSTGLEHVILFSLNKIFIWLIRVPPRIGGGWFLVTFYILIIILFNDKKSKWQPLVLKLHRISWLDYLNKINIGSYIDVNIYILMVNIVYFKILDFNIKLRKVYKNTIWEEISWNELPWRTSNIDHSNTWYMKKSDWLEEREERRGEEEVFHQSRMQLLFSRNGLFFCELKPTSRQSSCSCSLMNFMISITACETEIRLIAASRRSCSVIWRCCCKLEIIMSITAVSDRPILKGVVEQPSEETKGPQRRPWVTRIKSEAHDAQTHRLA